MSCVQKDGSIYILIFVLRLLKQLVSPTGAHPPDTTHICYHGNSCMLLVYNMAGNKWLDLLMKAEKNCIIEDGKYSDKKW